MFKRYVIQTKRLADAPPGRVGAAPARARIEKASSGFRAASQAARRERTFACRTDARPSRRGQLPAPRLGPVVARAGGVRRIHFAARALALSRPAPGQPSPTPACPGRALAGCEQVAGQTGPLVQDPDSGPQTGRFAAGNPAGRARRVLVPALDIPLGANVQIPTIAGRGARHRSRRERDSALVLDAG